MISSWPVEVTSADGNVHVVNCGRIVHLFVHGPVVQVIYPDHKLINLNTNSEEESIDLVRFLMSQMHEVKSIEKRTAEALIELKDRLTPEITDLIWGR
jgi:hypothetical protein